MPKDPSPSHSREFVTLLNELRVLLPGVEVLFAFLLTVPFSNGFETVSSLQRGAYFSAFMAAALATVLLVAPGVYHRLRWREADKEHVLRVANLFAIAGTACMAVATAASVFLVTDIIFGIRVAAGCSAGVALAMVTCWYVLPIWSRWEQLGARRRSSSSAERSRTAAESEPSPRPARARSARPGVLAPGRR